MSPKVTIRKYLGDDAHSWAVFMDGRPTVTGLSRREAQYHRDQIKKGVGRPRRTNHEIASEALRRGKPSAATPTT